MRPSFLTVLCVALVVLAPAAPAVALEARSAGTWSFSGGGLVLWIMEQQRAFHRELTSLLTSLRGDYRAEVVAGLLMSSFAYGVFHAAGPGHGKAVLTTYLFSNGASLRRSLWLATAASFLQGLVALALVYGLVVLGGFLPRESQSAAAWAERMSFVLVAAVGAYLLFCAARRLRGRWLGAPVGCGHSHHHHHHSACGHSHLPAPDQAERATDLRTAFGLILSIGLRPCSGAIIVLVFAQAFGIAWAGVGAVAAMSAGTALAVASLAFLAVSARGLALSLLGSRPTRLGLAVDLLALAGGLVIVALGVSLVLSSLSPRHPLGL